VSGILQEKPTMEEEGVATTRREERRTVCVTGGTGFISGHIIEELLKAGYHVRTTVRDVNNSNRTRHLLLLRQKYCLFITAKDPPPEEERPSLTIYEADLLIENSFDEAIQGIARFH
jgi:uncharacterized protein YbjT (DUF2867 family)